MLARRPDRGLIAAGLLLGIGLGGFVDGIVLHQLLQVHSMVSARFPKTTIENYQINMFWDGIFHAMTWLFTAAGIYALFQAGRHTLVRGAGYVLLGAMLLGWGGFNLAEGLIDHHLLQVHHVVEAHGLSIWDWLFLGSGLLLGAVGWWLIARHRPMLPGQSRD